MRHRQRVFSARPGQTEIILLFGQRDQIKGKERVKLDKLLFNKLSYIPKEVASGMMWARNKQDILYAGYLGLMKGIKWFDHTKCDNFELVGRQYVVKEIEREKKREGIWFTNVLENSIDLQEIVDTVADWECGGPEESCSQDQNGRLFTQLVGLLNEEEQMVVNLSYGIGIDEPVSVRQIADEMDLSIGKVIRIRNNSIEKLKAFYQDCC